MSTVSLDRNERSCYWDNIKGFLILLVVFAHTLYSLQYRSPMIESLVRYIYLFHMPAFVFVSGYFGKSKDAHSFEKNIKLVFLYFIFNSITVFIEYHKGFTSFTQPIYSYWYLLAMIAWRSTAHRISKYRIITILLFAVALVTGFFPSVDNHFAVARIIGFYPFYMLGLQLSEEKSAKLVSKKYGERALPGIAVLLGAAAVAFGTTVIFGYSDEVLKLDPYSEPLDMVRRIAMFVVSVMVITALRYLTLDKKIPLLTMFGRNSLWIFILHRMFTVWISDYLRVFPVPFILALSVLATFAICIAFGNDTTAGIMNKFLKQGTDIFLKDDKKITWAKAVSILVALGFVVVAMFSAYKYVPSFTEPSEEEEPVQTEETDIIYPVMTDSQKAAFDNSFRITFAGDLILLEDQVNRGYNGTGYDYSDVFEYAKPYISSADLAIGVFEGPMAGADKGYSTSNFYDLKSLYLNFPDEYSVAVKDAGFDLVTTANNHLLDKGEDGALRTLDVLDKTGLDHTGSYRNAQDKQDNHIKLVEVQGIKIAVLSYTYGSNYTDVSEFTDGRYSYLTSIIGGTEGKEFEKLKSSVEEDFRQAKAMSPDLILVLPHLGTQFSNEPDEEQKVWFEIFKENGADIILGDHPHVVEPVEIESYDGRTVFSAYCPGNFANIYRGDQGDTSMLVDVYIDRDSKQVIGGSIVPLYTYSPADGNYRAVPVYEIMNNTELRKQLTTDDIDRASDAHGIITDVVFGHEMDITSVTERYYFNAGGFIRSKATGLVLTDDMKDGSLYRAMDEAGSICFVGDSVTEGTKNGGCPWYEPIEEYFPGKNISNFSKGGCTVSYMLDNIEQIPIADLYVIAVGTNDVRYRDASVCAMNFDEYVSRIDQLKDKLLEKSPGAKFVFIAPWYSTEADIYCPMTFEEKTAMNDLYSSALEKYCSENGFTYINANDYIKGILTTSPDITYLLDHIHPNASKGVVMYSEAVLLSGKEQ